MLVLFLQGTKLKTLQQAGLTTDMNCTDEIKEYYFTVSVLL